jgi:hypothetical protein
MGRKSPTIFLGDLARAISELGISDPAALKLAAEMLGFNLDAVDAGKKGVLPETAVRGSAPIVPSENESETVTSAADVANVSTPETETNKARVVAIELSRTTGQKETWIPEVEPLPRQEDGPIVTPPLIPLLMPQWTRGILSAGLSTWDDEGLLDIEGVTEVLANGENVERFPTLLSLTLGRGVQLLLDKSQAMMPFVRDQAWLLKEIRNVVGADKVEVLRFIGSPGRGAGAGPRPWAAYQPPPPGVPVVILSDLGIRQPMLASDWADEDEWVAFADVVVRAHCPLIALVPYKSSRWPRSLTRLMSIVPWDRSTTAAKVNSLRKNPSGAKVI